MLIQCVNCANKDKSHHADGEKVIWCNAEHQFRSADFKRQCEKFQPVIKGRLHVLCSLGLISGTEWLEAGKEIGFRKMAAHGLAS